MIYLSMIYLGIDLHSNSFSCCYADDKGIFLRATYTFEPDSFAEFLKTLTPHTIVLIEASTTSFSFYDIIKKYVKEVYIANTHKLKLIAFSNRKTDKIDAQKLCDCIKSQAMSGVSQVPYVFVPAQDIREIRSLFSTYALLRKEITALKNRVHSILKQDLKPFTDQFIFAKKLRSNISSATSSDIFNYQIQACLATYDYCKHQQVEIIKKIFLLAAPYRNMIDILTSMDGISVKTAIGIIADVVDITRFRNSKALCTYLRSAPGIDQSNKTSRTLKTTKFGRKLSITFLSQSLNHFRDKNDKIHRWSEKKKEMGKATGKIRMAVCRRVIAEIYQMLKKNEYHYFRNAESHQKKMKAYDNFLKTNTLTSSLYNHSR